jgi:hypothetical protein
MERCGFREGEFVWVSSHPGILSPNFTEREHDVGKETTDEEESKDF